MKLFGTLQSLPDLSGRRFATTAMGSDQVTKIREEFSLLRSLAARVCRVEPDQLTQDDVYAAIAKLDAEVTS